MQKRYVSFVLGAGRYCVPVDLVHQILRHENLLEVPKAPPYVEGVINLRGEIIPVVSLRERLELAADPRRDTDERRRRIIVARLGDKPYGISVDEVREIVEIDDGAIKSDATSLFGERADFITGIAKRGETMLLVLDLPRVLGVGGKAPTES